MISRLRRWARRSIQRIERLIHPVRRRRARRRLRTLPDESSLLMVCLGNICRSPYAEHRLRDELAMHGIESIDIASAGFVRPGRPSPPEARRVANRRRIDLDEHRSRTLTPDMIRTTDAVFVMSVGQRRDLVRAFPRARNVFVIGDLDTDSVEQRAIVDPVDQSEEVFETVYERIDRCCGSIAWILADSRGGPVDPPAA